jgi:nucleoside-diphosphate-sugar epimerase
MPQNLAPPFRSTKSNWTNTNQDNGVAGYIGRFLALHIHRNNFASEVRLVDKVLPQLAWLAPEFIEACSQDKFVQADASREREST